MTTNQIPEEREQQAREAIARVMASPRNTTMRLGRGEPDTHGRWCWENLRFTADELVEIVAALAPLPPSVPVAGALGWRDIATAPLHVEIDVWASATEGEGWRKTGTLIRDNPHCLIDDDGRPYFPHENGGWFTHWMPLPAAPEEGEAHREQAASPALSGVVEALATAVPDYIEIYRLLRRSGRGIVDRAKAIDAALEPARRGLALIAEHAVTREGRGD